MVTDPSILAWEIPWTEGPGRIQFMDLQKVRHYLVIKQKILILLIDIMKIKTNSWANTSDNFQKVNCSVDSEIMSMSFSYPVALIHWSIMHFKWIF